MKITRDTPKFTPVTILLETKKEVKLLASALYEVYTHPGTEQEKLCDKISSKLEEFM